MKDYEQRRCDVGAQLKVARELKQLSIADVAGKLRTMVSLIGKLEAGRWDKIGPGTYGRGFARSYARLVEVELGGLDDCLEPSREDDKEIQLAAQARRRRNSVMRVQRFAAYTAATALIGIPLVFLVATAFRSQLVGDDQAATQQAVLASLVPVAPATDGLVLSASKATEVVVLDAAGATIWQGTIDAQATHRFNADAGLLVRFQNPNSIIATLNGQPLALAPYRIQQAVELSIPAADSR